MCRRWVYSAFLLFSLYYSQRKNLNACNCLIPPPPSFLGLPFTPHLQSSVLTISSHSWIWTLFHNYNTLATTFGSLWTELFTPWYLNAKWTSPLERRRVTPGLVCVCDAARTSKWLIYTENSLQTEVQMLMTMLLRCKLRTSTLYRPHVFS